MNMWVSAEPIDPATYARDAIARRRMLMGKPRLVPTAPRVEDKPARLVRATGGRPTKASRKPRPEPIEHMRAWMLHRASLNPVVTPRDFVKTRCLELRVEFSVMTKPCRRREVTEAKHLVIFEIKQRYPELSYPQIGRMFSMDHTSVLHAVRKMKARLESDAGELAYLERKAKMKRGTA